MFFQIEFRDFFTKKNFCELQRKFANMDSKQRYARESWNEPKVEIKISGTFRLLGDENNVVEFQRDFYNDFIIPNLDYLASEHIEIVEDHWKNQNIWSKEDRKGWSEDALTMIKKGRINLDSSDYLPKNIKNALIMQLDEFEELLSELLDNQNLELNPKLSFNWIRADVEYFFYRLREKNQIKRLSDAQLGKIIDTFCECLSDNKKKYKMINNSRKHLNNLTNQSRFPEESIKRLKNIFDESFFENRTS